MNTENTDATACPVIRKIEQIKKDFIQMLFAPEMYRAFFFTWQTVAILLNKEQEDAPRRWRGRL